MKSDIEWSKRTLNLFALDYGGKDEAKALVILLDRLKTCEKALAKIAVGTTPPEPHGHYLAHRAAVKIARDATANPLTTQPE